MARRLLRFSPTSLPHEGTPEAVPPEMQEIRAFDRDGR